MNTLSFVKRHSVTLSSAQIKAMHNASGAGPLTPVPGTGKRIVPISCLLVHNFGTVPYSNAAGAQAFVYLSTATEYASSNGGSWGLLKTSSHILEFGSSSLSPAALVTFGVDDCSMQGVAGEALSLFVGSPFTAGDGTLTVHTIYHVI